MSNNPFAKYIPAWYVDPYVSGGFVSDFEYTKEVGEEPKSLETMPNGVDGCTCTKCKLFYSYVVWNQKNKTYVCYSCRVDW